MVKRIIVIVAALVIIGAIIWIGVDRSRKEAAKNPVKVGVIVYPDLGPMYIAKEKDFFKKQGVNAEIVMLSLENMIPALQSGEVQMLATTVDMVPVIADAGIDAKEIFATSTSYGADGVVATSNVKSVTDLKGKKVYLYQGFPSHLFFRYLMEKNGLNKGDIELVNLNAEEVGSSFVAGKIDAGVTWEPWLSKATERKNGKVLLTTKDEPYIMVDTFMARTDAIQNRRKDIKKVMKAYFEAADWWMANRDEGDEIIAKNFNLAKTDFSPMVETIKLTGLKENIDLFDATKENNVIDLSKKAAKYYLEDGIIKNEVNVENYIDSSLVKELK